MSNFFFLPKCTTGYKYKFVIAFENSIDKDYVTEKFFDPLRVGSVPIYLGAPNIREFAPGKGSFIDVRDYPSPKELASVINSCYKSDILYEKFQEWRKIPFNPCFQEKIEKQNPFISLCEKVKDKLNEQEIIESELMTVGDVYLCSFSDSRLKNSSNRLIQQAIDMNIFLIYSGMTNMTCSPHLLMSLKTC